MNHTLLSAGGHGLLALVLCYGLLPGTPVASAEAAPKAKPVDFETQVLPILRAKCFRCHSDQQKKAELDLRSREVMLAGGNSGPAIEPGKSDVSLLIEMIESGEMPPAKEKNPVTREELVLLKKWIDAGAPAPKSNVGAITPEDRRFWSFVPPVRPAVPVVQHADRVRNPVDAFILQRLEARKLTLNPEADRRTLIRRLSFDLIGLPPTPRQIAEFLADEAPGAYERLVDRYLTSPHYGERWARHWLDTVGYADSNGRRGDETRPWAWRYRDFVVRSFNDDKPFDRFLVQQLAGDELLDWRSAPELTDEMVENLVATGFLRTVPDATDNEKVEMFDDRVAVVHDTVEVVANTLLGLTVGCAKCHTHKYDPIPQADFYRLQAFFSPAYRLDQWIPANTRKRMPIEDCRYITEGPPTKIAAEKQVGVSIDQAVKALQGPLEAIKTRYREQLRQQRLEKLPADAQALLKKPAGKRTAAEKKLVAGYEAKLKITDKVLQQNADYVAETKPLQAAIAAANAARPAKRDLIWGLWDLSGKPPETHLLIRGNPSTPGKVVQPGILQVLDDPQHPLQIRPPQPGAQTTGYRKQLAEWIIGDENPLTARVAVNRIWQRHFGRGIVASVQDFGKTGAAPTHPELLDWLAVEFREAGWSLKHIHRLLVLSATYRQSSVHSEEKADIDPDNELWWRRVPLRLEAELVRDALLSVSNTLNLQMYGPGVPTKAGPDGQFLTAGTAADACRRSLYLLNKRNESLTFLMMFDLPLIELDCPQRFCSTVVQQSLAMMNNPLVIQQAELFAGRIATEAPPAPAETVRWAFEQTLGRLPTASEQQTLVEFYQSELKEGTGDDARRQALFQLAHTLFNTNEFLYID